MSSAKSDSEQEKIGFLCRSENIDIAFEIYERFSDVLRQLQTKFWDQVESIIKETISKSPDDFCGWTYDRCGSSPTASYFGASLIPANPNLKEYCYPCLSHTTVGDNFRLRYGIGLNGPKETRDLIKDVPQYQGLLSALKHFDRREPEWICLKRLDDRLYSREILNALSRDDKTRSGLLVGDFIKLFRDARKMMEDLNRALPMK
jgi:hypothetical protein